MTKSATTRTTAARRPVTMAAAAFLGAKTPAASTPVPGHPHLAQEEYTGQAPQEATGSTVRTLVPAAAFLQRASDAIVQRGKERDTGHDTGAPAERTMVSAVTAFNALHGTQLTEREGWAFMAVLKLARAHSAARNDLHNPDDYVDGAAYMALAGESVGYRSSTGA